MKNLVTRSTLLLILLLLGAMVTSASAQSTCTGGSSLSGWYGLLVGSYTGSGGKYLAGALHFDGACGITGSNTYGGVGGNAAAASVTGSYGQNGDGTFGITLNLAGQATPQTYIVGVSQSGNEAVGIETDGTSAFIDLQSQLTSLTGGYTNASLNGTYAAACIGSGVDLNYQTFGADGNGNITGVDSEQNNGVVTTNTSYTGSYTVNSDGTFSGSVLFNGSNVPFYGVLDNGNNEIEYIYTGVNSCSGKKSTTTTLSGSYGMLVSGTSTTAGSGEQFLTGVINFNGGSLSGEVNGGVNGVYANSPITGTYSVLSNNTVAINMSLTNQGLNESYNVGVSETGNEADGIETDNLATATVDLQSQASSSSQTYSSSNLIGTYAVVCSNIGLVALNYVTFDGVGTLSGSLAYSDGGNYAGDTPITGTYSVNADGTFSGSLGGGFAAYTFTGALENDGAEISYTYEEGGTGNQACSGVSTYGPIGALTAAATPTFGLAPGAYTGTQSVTLSDTTAGAVIHYTTNSTPPTPNSPVYTTGTPISVSTTTAIEAIAVAPGYSNSAIASGTYFVTPIPAGSVANPPVLSTPPGTYNSTVTLGLSDTTPGSHIYYTVDGSTPPSSPTSQLYNNAPITISQTTTVYAVAIATGYTNSAVVGGLYTINLPQAATPMFGTTAPGTYDSSVSVTLSDTTAGATIYYTTNNTTPTPIASEQYTPGAIITVNSNTTIQAIAVASGYTTSSAQVGLYTITPPAPAPTFNPPPGTFTSATPVTLSAVAGATIYYTTNNTTPTAIASEQYTPGAIITVSGTTTIKAIAVGGGYSSSSVAIGAYTIASAAKFTVSASSSTFTLIQNTGSSLSVKANPLNGFSGTVTFTASGFPSGASYTFLTGSSTSATLVVYVNPGITPGTYPITVTGTSGSLTASTTFNFVIAQAPIAATPTFSLTPGAYGSTQTVALSDATPGVTISYSINNGSYVTYSKPLTVSASATISAVAIASSGGGYNNSATATAAYTISTTSVASLGSTYNIVGIGTTGSSPKSGGFDTNSYAYNSSLLGTSLSYQGVTFPLAAANTTDAVSSTTIPVTAQYSYLYLLGAAVNGAKTNQSIVVTYTDGSSSTFTQNFSDWTIPLSYGNETVVSHTANRIVPNGGTQNGNIYVYGYAFALTAGKTVAKVALPANRAVVFLGMGFGNTNTQPTQITPYIQVNYGAWQSASSVTVLPFSLVNLGPQPLNVGSWSWTSSNGYSSTSRQINNIPLSIGLNVYVATYTNPSGVKSALTFYVTVN
jgi:hypothetical protein